MSISKEPRRAAMSAQRVGGPDTAPGGSAPPSVVEVGLLDATFDAVVDAMIAVDAAGRIVRANTAFCTLLGITPDDPFFGASLAERMRQIAIADPTGEPLLVEKWPLTRILQGEHLGAEDAPDILIRTRAGDTVRLSPSGSPLRASDGTVMGAVAVYRDVTTRRQAEHERQRLASVLEVMPAGVALYDATGRLIHQNAASARITGRTADASVAPAERLAQYGMRGEDGSALTESESPSGRARRGETFTDLACVITGPTGQDVHLLTSGAPLPVAGADDLGAVVVFQDMTPLRILEQEIQAQRDLAESMIATTPNGVALFDATDDFRCLRHNQPYLALLGAAFQAKGSVVGVPARDLLDAASGAQVVAIFSQVRDTGQPVIIEEFPAVTPPDPAVRWYKWSLSPLRNARGTVISLLGSAFEITDQVLAREVQRQEAARLQAVLDVMPTGVAIADQRGGGIQVNPTFRQIWGTDDPFLSDISADHYQAWWPDGRPVSANEWALAQAMTQGTTVSDQEIDILSTDGARKTVLNAAAPIRDATGAITGGVVATRDITYRKRLEGELAARATELEGIFAAISAAVIVFDAEGHITRLNPAAEALYDQAGGPGFHQQNFFARTTGLTLHDTTGAILAPERWPAMRLLQGETIVGEDVHYVTQQGVSIALNLAGVPLRDARGTITGGITVYQDVTERHTLERRTHQSLDALLRMARYAVGAGGDLHLAARELAQVTSEVLGCRRAAVMSVASETQIVRPIAVVGLSPAEEAQWWTMQPADARFGEGGDPEQTARFAAGEALVIDMTQPPLNEQPNPFGITTALFIPMRLDGRLVGFLSLDHAGARHVYTDQEIALARGVADLAALVVEREHLQAANATAQARTLALQEINTRMHTFLGIAGHELRTPVTSIKTSVQLTARVVRQALGADLPDTLRPRMQRAVDLLDGVNRQADKLNRFIADLLDVTRIQTGTLDIQPVDLDLGPLVRETTESLQRDWPGRNVTVIVPATPVWVAGDADRLGQVVTNLVTNALKYSPVDQPIVVRLGTTDHTARIDVTDHGPGLSLEQQAILFQAFSQVEGIQPISGAGIGLGLGLFICQTIIKRHGGRLGVASTVGAGATFWCDLPLVEEA